jgi:hypothetical protein
MKYPAMGNARSYRVSLPELNGGVYASLPPNQIADNQLSDVLNMWYKDGRLQTRPAFVTKSAGQATNIQSNLSIHQYKGGFFSVAYDDYSFECIVFDKSALFVKDFWIQNSGIKSIVPVTVNADSTGAVSGNSFLLLIFYKNGDADIFAYNETTKYLSEIEPYVPTLVKNGEPAALAAQPPNGVTFEPKNILGNRFKCSYTTDGKGWIFVLPESIENAVKISAVYDDGTDVEPKEHSVTVADHVPSQELRNHSFWQETTDRGDKRYLRVDVKTNEVWFTDKNGVALDPLPLADRGNNVTVTVEQKSAGELSGMKFSTWFGGGSSGLSGGTRVFLSGDSADQSLVVWSSLNNPLYYPATNYAYVGNPDSPVTAFGKQSDMLVVFKTDEIYCMQYRQGYTPTAEQLENQEAIDVESAQALFPMFPIHPEIGCDCPDTICLCDNRLVWLNSDGRVYGLFSNGQFSENNVRELSKAVEPYLLNHSKGSLQSASAEKDGNHYFLLVDGDMYVLDYSSNGFSYYSSYSTDEKAQKMIAWYRWNIGLNGVQLDREERPYAPFLFETERTITLFANAKQSGKNNICSFETADGGKDQSINGEEENVHAYFQTKQFDFGNAERLKKINPFYLQITGDDGEKLNLTYLNANKQCLDEYSPVMKGEDLLVCNPIRVTPNANRVRTFGLKVEGDGHIEVGSLTLNYSMMGTVR